MNKIQTTIKTPGAIPGHLHNSEKLITSNRFFRPHPLYGVRSFFVNQMSKHSNKYWIKEKEFISLNREYEHLWGIIVPRYGWNDTHSSRLSEIKRRLENKFYNEYFRYRTTPSFYKKMENRSQRYKAKVILSRLLKGEDIYFEDNYKSRGWW